MVVVVVVVVEKTTNRSSSSFCCIQVLFQFLYIIGETCTKRRVCTCDSIVALF